MDLNEKVRPTEFDQVVGQVNLKNQIQKALEVGEFPRFSLFEGPTGLGKSTLAQIVANQIAGEQGQVRTLNMGEYTNTKDMSEMVKGIFGLKPGKHNLVYVLEEVQVLSEAQQTPFLQEVSTQPESVYIIMCTTEPRKLLPAFLGRASRYVLTHPSTDDCVELVERVCQAVGLTPPSKEVSKWMTRRAKNTPRELVKYIQQLKPIGHMSDDVVFTYLGAVGHEKILTLFESAKDKDLFSYSRALEDVQTGGKDLFAELRVFMQDVFYQTYGFDKSLFTGKYRKRVKEIFEGLSEEQFMWLLTEIGNMQVNDDNDAFYALLEVRQLMRGEHKSQQQIVKESKMIAKKTMLESERKESGYVDNQSTKVIDNEGEELVSKAKLVDEEATVDNVQGILGSMELYE